MLELGETAAAEHATIGRAALADERVRLVAVGPGAGAYLAGLDADTARRAVAADELEAAHAMLAAALRPGDVVLCKASRAIGLDRLARLLAEGRTPGETPPGAVLHAGGPAAGQDGGRPGAPVTGTVARSQEVGA
jgi:UDP-N-acetylmuramoyl-tripeptide--D-alanyl-D-alanine ligase